MENALITLSGGSPVVSSAVIAEGVGKEHKPVIRLVRDNQEDLEEFGRVRFENAPFETAGGQQSREVALLSEPQATLLLTYMRNNDVVRAFKKRLVKAFFEMREKLMAEEKARLAVEAEKAKEPRSLSGLTDEERRIGFTAAKKRCAGLPLSEEETRIVRLYERVKMRAYRDRRKAAKTAKALPAAAKKATPVPAPEETASPDLTIHRLLTSDRARRAANEAVRAMIRALPGGTPVPRIDLHALANGIILESLKFCEIRITFDYQGTPTAQFVTREDAMGEKFRPRVYLDDMEAICGVIRTSRIGGGLEKETVQKIFEACMDRLSSPNGEGYGNVY